MYCRLEEYGVDLAALGIRTVEDLISMTTQDVDLLQLKQFDKRRYDCIEFICGVAASWLISFTYVHRKIDWVWLVLL